ncbi:potassium channel subfamily K member 4 [Hypomesus transpacificus]|uniref:potassium channel subfamily K member 4 n=1 Tax=Hypomesus transpacificus TaxID=137520 RepID=UPI001F074A36|nr:potassium channel subfamily K member 4 [Hypomesus transpacificus]
MRCPTLMALLAGVMLYLVMGALVFRWLEAPKESSDYENLRRNRRTFLHNHTCVTEEDLGQLINNVVEAVDAGLDATSTSPNFTSRWDLSSAFFFCGTIITTIGFGNLSPKTGHGQLFCLCYALVGIPMFGILLAGVGDHMGTGLRKAVANIETLFLKRRVSPTIVRIISAVLSILIGCLIFLAVPTVVFHKVEGWSFLESLYFVVITLTTVGFGDYVAGNRQNSDLFKPLVWLWIVFGLAYFASILTMIANWFRVLSKRTRAEMEELRAHATDWTQNIQNMSMDFRIPNPLDLNDPFLLQRRRWKRSTRRRVRRCAQVTLGYRARGCLENGHLPKSWVSRSCSMSRLEVQPLEGPRLSPVPRRLLLKPEERSLARLLARSMSLPAARSVSELKPRRSRDSESVESDSRSDISSSDSQSYQDYQVARRSQGGRRGQGGQSVKLREERGRDERGSLKDDRGREERGNCDVDMVTMVEMRGNQRKERGILGEKHESWGKNRGSWGGGRGDWSEHRGDWDEEIPVFMDDDSPYVVPPPLPHSLPPSLSTPTNTPPNCPLLDFFGENLAYIDESSDTLSDRFQPSDGGSNGGKRAKPHKPQRQSMRRQLPHRSPLEDSWRRSSELQPPSNPPTPPPLSSLGR